MEFCVISPTAGLEEYASRSKRHMVLTPVFIRDAAYRNYYLRKRDEGDFIILDNGVYEKDYREIDFLLALKTLQPNVACLPDVLCKGPESLARSLKFFFQYHKNFPNTEWMLIPQGQDKIELQSICDSLYRIFEDGDIWIGLSRFLNTHTVPNEPCIRVSLADAFKSLWPSTSVHCMGMANGDTNELRVLAQQGWVESIDSSAPVWRGWNGFDIDNKTWDTKGTDVDFSAERSTYSDLIDQNLEVVLGYCKRV